MANQAKDAAEAQYLQLVQADPTMQQLARQLSAELDKNKKPFGRPGDFFVNVENRPQIDALQRAIDGRFSQVLAEHGIKNDNYAAKYKGGNLIVDHQNWYERNSDWLLPMVAYGLIGGVMLPALMAGPAAGAAPGAAAPGAAAALPGAAAPAAATLPAALPAAAAPAAAALPAATLPAAAATAGGILPKILTAADIASEIGGVADRYNTRKAADQASQANYNIDYDKNAIGRYVAELNASQQELDRRKYSDDAYQQAISDRVYGSMLQGVNDVSITPPPGITMGQITGGLRPSIIGNRGAVGSELEANASTRMQHPTALPDLPAVPDLSATGLDQSGLDKLMDVLGFAGGAGGTAEEILARLRRPPARSTQPAAAPTTLPDLPSWSSSANMYPGGVDPNARR